MKSRSIITAQNCLVCRRNFTTSSSTLARLRRQPNPDDPLDMVNQRALTFEDLPVALHNSLDQAKEKLHYHRLIESYLPTLSSACAIGLDRAEN